MNETKRKTDTATEEGEIEALIHHESENALRRFRAGDFAASLNDRLASPPPRRPFILFRRSVLVPSLGLAALAAFAMFILPGGGNGRLETGFRFMTEALSGSAILQAIQSSAPFEDPDVAAGGRGARGLAALLFRIVSQRDAAPAGGEAPLRPLFSPKERFKILYGDRAILRVLMDIAGQKEV